MKKAEVKIGGKYYANVTGKKVEIQIDSEKPSGGWNATNLATGKKIAGGDLRCLTSSTGGPEYLARARPPKHVCDHRSLMEFARNCDANYLYVFQDGQWHCHKM